jgi:hypothetical protein
VPTGSLNAGAAGTPPTNKQSCGCERRSKTSRSREMTVSKVRAACEDSFASALLGLRAHLPWGKRKSGFDKRTRFDSNCVYCDSILKAF